MIPEIGHYALIVALIVAIIQIVVPLWGTYANDSRAMRVSRNAAFGQFFAVSIAFLILIYAFLDNDFSVRYVATHSNSQLPVYYKVSAVWGGHEGSLLLWAFILAGWTAAVASFSRHLPLEYVARVLVVMGIVSVGFLSFMLFTSNPFDRHLPFFPIDGGDLNPLLQDIGLILHPPMLYMGYVGFSVAFAFAIAALLGGRLDAAWARWSRPWTTVAWIFMTIGIALGSWWAYYELGWGGWWFWDPVENASFMPWLVGTALIHSLAVTEKRNAFKAWTALLAIAAFSLSLLGTFLVRSGVLTSVHAFATDPTRGLFILVFLAAVVGGSLFLFAIRASNMESEGRFEWFSREMSLLLNNVVLAAAAGLVLVGTLFPLIWDVLKLGKLSIGAPYFNFFFVPLTFLVLVLMTVGPLLRWKRHDLKLVAKRLAFPLVAAVCAALFTSFMMFGTQNFAVYMSFGFAFWIVAMVIIDLSEKLRNKSDKWRAFIKLPRSYKGMQLAHIGVLVSVLGVAVSSYYSVEKDVRVTIGTQVEVGPYKFEFVQFKRHPGPNYVATRADVKIYKHDKYVGELHPEKRFYNVQKMPMTEAGILPSLAQDLYVALGEPLDGGAWAARVYYKPFIRWIWLGAIFMALGGLLAVADPRYRLKRQRNVSESGTSSGDSYVNG